ncbi:CD2 antigen cytoplasmic tail-binding protein 2 [Kwoniella heveanensis BCC8398]|uniref:CD2 antigen cytoplasmic tail-binding protein 2 n=1 Tax=Kwoniella heveanensis BCC8398 TaxID=1296120 RepID=A0A1B9GVV3_9TREE|nr:CD2 antigen cytoplasmic tail-binding protein 2 [Kwoniella heveanensis BCC8398]
MPVKRTAAGSSSDQKRTRFTTSPSRDSPAGSISDAEDNDLLEEDLPQGAKQNKQRAKKKLRDQEGYGSDSSNDDEGVVPSRRPGAKPDEEEDDDVDMFADDVDEKGKGKEADKGKGKGRADEFMDISQIEGQEFGKPETGRGGADDDEDSDSGDEAQAKKNVGTGLDGDMGTDITPFNMKSEMTEGRFTADGEEYLENDKDPNDKHDMWLENVDKEEIKEARRAHRERERLEKEREEKENSQTNKEREIALLRDAVELMERGETVLEALQRLGQQVEEQNRREAMANGGAAAGGNTGGKKKSWVERQKERKKLMAVEQEQADPTHTSNPFTNLTNIVSSLTNTVQIDVYSLSRESIQRMLPRQPDNSSSANGGASGSGNGRPAAPPPPPEDQRMFQYRFSMAYVRSLPEAQRPVEREVFGPFPVQQLKQWRNTGFFGGPACENVELRLAGDGSESSNWGTWDAVVG